MKNNSGRDFLDALPMDQCYYVCDEISNKYKKYGRVKYIYDRLNEESLLLMINEGLVIHGGCRPYPCNGLAKIIL